MRTVNIPILALLLAAVPRSCEGYKCVPLTRRTPIKNGANCIQSTTTICISPSLSYQRRRIPLYASIDTNNSNDADSGNGVESFDQRESKVMSMKVVELKAELKSNGQPISGLKKVLQERLLDFYRTAEAKAKTSGEENDNILAKENDDENVEAEDLEEEKDIMIDMVEQDESQDEDEEEDYDDDNYSINVEDDDEDNDELDFSWVLSKRKWKKKTFLLMEDVRKLAHSRDAATRKKGPRKAKEALRRMQNWISSASLYNTEENVESIIIDQRSTLLKAYNLWIHALAKSGYHDAGHQAEEVLKEMQRNELNGGPSPDEVTIASVMDAHAHSARVSSSSSGGAKAAESFLFRLLDKHEERNNNIPWSQDGNNALRNSLIVTCDTMLNAWAREGTMESAERALLILLRLEDYQRQAGKQQNKARSKSNNASKNARKTRPISYSTVMNAWANVRSGDAAEKAEATLESIVIRAKAEKKEKQKDYGEQTKLVSIEPDTILFNSVIQCWAASRDMRAGEKSLRLLKQMKELAGVDRRDDNGDDKDRIYFNTHPDIITYNTILSAWSHCGKKNAAPQAEKIVKELVTEQEERRKQERKSDSETDAAVLVNTVTFNTVLDAWSKSRLPGATDRAGDLLEYMMQSRDYQIAPDIYSFTCVMDALAKSKVPNKASQTRELLDRLTQMHNEALRDGNKRGADALRPTQVPYNTVLNACAFSALKTSEQERRDAIRIAVDIYKSMSSRTSLASFRRKGNGSIVARDAITYGVMLKCIANLMPRGKVRNQMGLQIFQECCDDGLVGYMAWNEVRRAIPAKIVQEACGFKRQVGSLEHRDLPREWTKNCREKKGFNKQRQKEQSERHRKSKPKPAEKEPAKAFIIERSFATGKDM